MSLKNRAFTLIELLTVIAIIGILAAILIPVVGKVRESARASKCVSNLRSTSTAMLSHINDNDGVLYTMRSGSTNYLWTRVLAEEGYYVLRTGGIPPESILCPDIPYRDGPEGAHHFDGYGLNVFDPQASSGTYQGPSGSTNVYIRNFNDNTVTASRYILFADSLRTDTMRQVFRLYAQEANGSGSIVLAHNQRANIAFLDGHVESLGATDIRRYEPEVRSGYNMEGKVVAFPDPNG